MALWLATAWAVSARVGVPFWELSGGASEAATDDVRRLLFGGLFDQQQQQQQVGGLQQVVQVVVASALSPAGEVRSRWCGSCAPSGSACACMLAFVWWWCVIWEVGGGEEGGEGRGAAWRRLRCGVRMVFWVGLRKRGWGAEDMHSEHRAGRMAGCGLAV